MVTGKETGNCRGKLKTKINMEGDEREEQKE